MPSDAASRPRQFGRIDPQLFASPARHARVDDLMRTAEWNLGPSSFSMHRDHDLALMPLLMFAVIEAAALLEEPRSECAAFHGFASVEYLIQPLQPAAPPIRDFLRCRARSARERVRHYCPTCLRAD